MGELTVSRGRFAAGGEWRGGKGRTRGGGRRGREGKGGMRKGGEKGEVGE